MSKYPCIWILGGDWIVMWDKDGRRPIKPNYVCHSFANKKVLPRDGTIRCNRILRPQIND